jgi:hypothetical protein
MTDEHEGELKAFDVELYKRDYPTCGRPRKKQPGLCTRPAGWGTVHSGRGACKLHGGIKSAERDRRLKTGGWSMVADVRVQEIQAELEELGNPLDVTRDLTLARAIMISWAERHEKLMEALLAWNETRRAEDRPAKLPELVEIIPAIEAISRIVYRIEKSASDKFVPRGTFYRIMMAMGRVIELRVHDENVREQIRQDWLKIEAV